MENYFCWARPQEEKYIEKKMGRGYNTKRIVSSSAWTVGFFGLVARALLVFFLAIRFECFIL